MILRISSSCEAEGDEQGERRKEKGERRKEKGERKKEKTFSVSAAFSARV
jgi:hypothetical protein